MKQWTANNLHEFNIEAVDMGTGQEEIAEWVEKHIFDTATPETLQAYLDNADEFIPAACEALGWSSVPAVGGLIVNIWDD